ncbi:MAG TPA: amidohydrolase family protein [Thermoanaerobaculia bacterium]|nr:amidohydrolase family protein [Thermoanaerobaculia bacterium]
MTIAFRGATLVDGTGAPPIPSSLLVVENGRIVSVGAATPEALAKLPAGARVIDGEGRWIVPGLIDAHVHAESDADLQTMLQWGVTSVRLMAEDVAASQKLAAESRTRKDIPEVFPAAPIFTVRGGWWGRDEPADPNLNRFPATPEEARRSVRRARELGGSEIKVMLDDMAWCRAPLKALPKTTPAVLEALLAEARAQGMRSIVHAPNLEDAKAAVAGGADALAHGVLDPIDDATLAALKARAVSYVPTMDIFEFLADARRFLAGALGPPGIEAFLRPETVARYRSDAYAAGYRERYPNFASVDARLPVLRENLRKLYAAGVPVALGTDMWALPGAAVSVEMKLYVAAGLPPLEALRAATQTAARSLGVDGDRGTLEKGKRADLVVLASDPAGPSSVRDVDGVWKGGERVAPTRERRGP